jgi:hypothetical protein
VVHQRDGRPLRLPRLGSRVHAFTNETCEAALAHVIENKVEAAYRRGDLFDKRRKLIEAWAVYCAASKSGKVVAFRR